MQTNQTERQALDAAIDAALSAVSEAIVLTPIVSHHDGAMQWLENSNYCSGYVRPHMWHWYQRTHGNRDGTPWFGHERMVDQFGRLWGRSFDAIVDDFGSLVEVQR